MAGRFTVVLTKSFRRDLERLDLKSQEKVLKALSHLETSPTGPPPKVAKLRGKGVGKWRLRVWPYRVRYDIEGTTVLLYRVRHRKDIYED